MTTQEKFEAAVNVIRNLPKNGAYQPSKDLMLRFYAYFKQATEGPCTQSKPAFWDVVGKYKWDAWNRLGNMPKHEAMNNYVEELKKIVETMSYNENVGNFLGSLGDFYDNIPAGDLELLLGPVLERVRSQPGSPLQGSPFGSREASPTRVPNNAEINRPNLSSLETSPVSSMSPSPQPPDTDDDEEFIDTVETTPHASRKAYKNTSLPIKEEIVNNKNNELTTNNTSHLNGHVVQKDDSDEDDFNTVHRGRVRERDSPNISRRRVVKQNGTTRNNSWNGTYMTDVNDPIREAVLHLQKDLDRINQRVRSLEVTSLSSPSLQGGSKAAHNSSTWWPLDISPRTTLVLLAWPFLAHLIISYIQRRQKY